MFSRVFFSSKFDINSYEKFKKKIYNVEYIDIYWSTENEVHIQSTHQEKKNKFRCEQYFFIS